MSEQLWEAARAAVRPINGRLTLDGPRAPIRIRTDAWGVPHVWADSREDLWFAQGWLHAAERRFQIDYETRTALGRLSEVLGPEALASDRFYRTLGFERIIRSWTPDAASRRIASAYGRGMQQATRLPPAPEFKLLGAKPLRFDETLHGIWARMLRTSFLLSRNWDLELLRVQLAAAVGFERAIKLTQPTSSEDAAARARTLVAELSSLMANTSPGGSGGLGSGTEGLGSNAWAVSGERTATGRPLLCNDPHTMIATPSSWMLMHLTCPDLDVIGASLPGVPGIMLGHNTRIAWGFTNGGFDCADLYLERMSPDRSRHAEPGGWVATEVRVEQIEVRGEDPVTHRVFSTARGPVLDGEPTFSLRWASVDQPMSLAPIEALDAASDWESFRAAVSAWPFAGQAMTYADVDGHIGMQCSGRVPVRARGSGGVPGLGFAAKSEWNGIVSFDELPSILDPDAGFVAVANADVSDPDGVWLTADWDAPYRVRRIRQLLLRGRSLTLRDMAEIQTDTHSGLADDFAEFMPDDPVLRGWNHKMDADSAGAALFAAWLSSAARLVFEPLLGSIAESYLGGWSLRAHLALLEVARDPAAWDVDWAELSASALDAARAAVADQPWGDVHRAAFVHPLVGRWDSLNAGTHAAGGGVETVHAGYYAGDFAAAGIGAYRQIIDVGDWDASVCVVAPGNSGNPASPYWGDQATLWAAGGYHQMPFSAAAVAEAAPDVLTLVG